MTHTTEIHASVAMLASLFGDPAHADSDANRYEWHVRFEDGGSVVLRNTGSVASAGRMQSWEVAADSPSALTELENRLHEGENYYEGVLHPELFIHREQE